MKKLFGFFSHGQGEAKKPKQSVPARAATKKACRALRAIPCLLFAAFAFLSFALMATPVLASSASNLNALNGDELRRTLRTYWSDTLSDTYAGTFEGTQSWSNYYSLFDNIVYTQDSYETENVNLLATAEAMINKASSAYLSEVYTSTFDEMNEKLYEEYRALSAPEGLTEEFNKILADKIAENATKEEDEQKSLSALAADAAAELTEKQVNSDEGKYAITDEHFPSTTTAYAEELSARDAKTVTQWIATAPDAYTVEITGGLNRNRTAVDREAVDCIAAYGTKTLAENAEKVQSAVGANYKIGYTTAQAQMKQLISARTNLIVQSLVDIEVQNDRVIADKAAYDTLQSLGNQFIAGQLSQKEFFDKLDEEKIVLLSEIREDKEKTEKEPAESGWETLSALLQQYNNQEITYEVLVNRLNGLKDDGNPYASTDPEEGRNIAFVFSSAPANNDEAREFDRETIEKLISGQLTESAVKGIMLSKEVESNIVKLRSKIAVADDKTVESELDKKEGHTTLYVEVGKYFAGQPQKSLGEALGEAGAPSIVAESKEAIAAYMTSEIVPQQGLFYEKETLRTYLIASIVVCALTLIFALVSALCHFALSNKRGTRGAETALSCVRYMCLLASILMGVLVMTEAAKDATGLVSAGVAPLLLIIFSAVCILGSLISSAIAARAAKRHLARSAETGSVAAETAETEAAAETAAAEEAQPYAEAHFTQKTKLALRLYHGIALIVFSILTLALCALPAFSRTVMGMTIGGETSIFGAISFSTGFGVSALALVLFAAAGIPFGAFMLLRNKMNAETKYCSVILFYVPMLIIMTALAGEMNGYAQRAFDELFISNFHIVTYMDPSFAAAYVLGFFFLLVETVVLCTEAGFGAWDPFDWACPPEPAADESVRAALAELSVPAAVPAYPAYPAFPVCAGYTKEDFADFCEQQATYRAALQEWKRAVAERHDYFAEMIRYYYIRHLTLKGKSTKRVGDLNVWLWWNFAI